MPCACWSKTLLYEALLEVGARVRLHVVYGGAHLAFRRRVTDGPWHGPEMNELLLYTGS